MFEAKLGPEHPNLINVLSVLGEAELALAAYDDARAHFERARALTAGADAAVAWICWA